MLSCTVAELRAPSVFSMLLHLLALILTGVLNGIREKFCQNIVTCKCCPSSCDAERCESNYNDYGNTGYRGQFGKWGRVECHAFQYTLHERSQQPAEYRLYCSCIPNCCVRHRSDLHTCFMEFCRVVSIYTPRSSIKTHLCCSWVRSCKPDIYVHMERKPACKFISGTYSSTWTITLEAGT